MGIESAEINSKFNNFIGKNAFGFTLAEVLITLVIVGIISAFTIPALITNIRKYTVETRLKYSYTLLNQAAKLAQVDYGEISSWNMTNTEYFVNTYVIPYIKTQKITKTVLLPSMVVGITLSNGIVWKFRSYSISGGTYYYIQVEVDINGEDNPNSQGIDKFNFYIFPGKRGVYNTGVGDCAHNVKNEGIYYDGYGVSIKKLKTAYYRGCGEGTDHKNSYCIALIVQNNWKIPNDYPLKF